MSVLSGARLFILLPLLAAAACAAIGTGGEAPGIETRIVLVEGSPIRVRTAGLENREPGTPVVVFESGGSTPLETWNRIFPAVARIAPVVAYDRPGTGESPWDEVAPTPERIATLLRRLLTEIGADPPFVLVGHSWGAALARYFAGLHPEEVSGVLYLDPTDITQSPADEAEVFEAIGADPSARAAFEALMEQSLAEAPAAARAEGEVILDLFRREVEDRGIPPAPDVPTSVIVAGEVTPLPADLVPFDTEAYAREVQRRRIESLRAWVRPPGTFQVAEDIGHFVHDEEPDLVYHAIQSLLEAAAAE